MRSGGAYTFVDEDSRIEVRRGDQPDGVTVEVNDYFNLYLTRSAALTLYARLGATLSELPTPEPVEVSAVGEPA